MSVSISEIKKSGKSALEYNQSGREWLLGHPDGRILSYPAGDEGKIAAQMSALHHDVPNVAQWIESLMAAHPLESVRRRLVKAGFLIRDGHVLSLNSQDGGYIAARILSSRKEKRYSVWYNLTWHCSCEDWENGDAYRFGHQRASFAPVIEGLGIMCKHTWAAYIAAQLDPETATCPECNGDGIFIMLSADIPGLWLREECPLCSGTGRVPEEWVEPLLEPGPDPVELLEEEIPF